MDLTKTFAPDDLFSTCISEKSDIEILKNIEDYVNTPFPQLDMEDFTFWRLLNIEAEKRELSPVSIRYNIVAINRYTGKTGKMGVATKNEAADYLIRFWQKRLTNFEVIMEKNNVE